MKKLLLLIIVASLLVGCAQRDYREYECLQDDGIEHHFIGGEGWDAMPYKGVNATLFEQSYNHEFSSGIDGFVFNCTAANDPMFRFVVRDGQMVKMTRVDMFDCRVCHWEKSRKVSP